VHVLLVQAPLVQHGWPEAPHLEHVPSPFGTKGATQRSSPKSALPHHGSPAPPHGTHTFVTQAVRGAVHSCANPSQHGCQRPPHGGEPHAPLLHVPSDAPQSPWLAMHVRSPGFWTQQPPFAHVLPAQHGSSGPPHEVHPVTVHNVPLDVQKG
jgi:hypothetical protein